MKREKAVPCRTQSRCLKTTEMGCTTRTARRSARQPMARHEPHRSRPLRCRRGWLLPQRFVSPELPRGGLALLGPDAQPRVGSALRLHLRCDVSLPSSRVHLDVRTPHRWGLELTRPDGVPQPFRSLGHSVTRCPKGPPASPFGTGILRRPGKPMVVRGASRLMPPAAGTPVGGWLNAATEGSSPSAQLTVDGRKGRAAVIAG